ncbi:hypothetical protein SAMN04488515_0464 [Cognatiyoonia koreensis]|uniref:Plastocyanin n=1 Tax=Cognatiyoonia koreensis TaxID=364200 RepID=A0A1I0N936_9RHOB|nr:hypothetical protein [Cognatiyoonia koreensis]SEV97364.1 hypothetical protein SAMN04488515_0464 [Cognatiyoonia koreensis]
MKHIKNLALAAVLALPAAASSAQEATEHLVLVERYGFYPSKIYVEAGDTIVFENRSPNWVRLFSEDPYDNGPDYEDDDPCDDDGENFDGSRDGFSISWFSIGSQRTYQVSACSETRFYAPEVYNSGGTDWNKRIDLIVYGEAPNG